MCIASCERSEQRSAVAIHGPDQTRPGTDQRPDQIPGSTQTRPDNTGPEHRRITIHAALQRVQSWNILSEPDSRQYTADSNPTRNPET